MVPLLLGNSQTPNPEHFQPSFAEVAEVLPLSSKQSLAPPTDWGQGAELKMSVACSASISLN